MRQTDQNADLGSELLRRAGLAEDAGFEESKHPRAENGQFGSGGGSTRGGSTPEQKQEAHEIGKGMERAQNETEAAAKKFPVGSFVRPNNSGSKPAKVTGHNGNLIETTREGEPMGLLHVSKAVAHNEGGGEGGEKKTAVSQQSLKARVSAQMDNIHKALGPEKYEVVRKAAYEKGASPEQIGEAEKLLESVGHGEKREPGALAPKKAMSEGSKKSNAKAMSSAAANASASAKTAKTDTARSSFEEASTKLAEAAQAYADGDHEKGASLEKLGFYAQFHAEANNH